MVFSFANLSQQIVSGLATGSIYALGAFGLVLIFKTMDTVNFAQGKMAMVTAFVAWTCVNNFHLPYWAAFLVAVVVGAMMGGLIERIFLRPVQGSSPLTLIIITLGLVMILEGVAGWIFGFDTKTLPEAIKGEPLTILMAKISPHNLLIMGVTLAIMIGIFLFFKYTMAGIAIRATAQDIPTSYLMGINVSRVFSTTWIVSAMLGAIAGILISPVTFVSTTMMDEIQLKAFSAAVLGGFTSLGGAVLGGLILGVLENLVAGYISPEFKASFAFGLIILILWIKPSGLLGTVQRKKV